MCIFFIITIYLNLNQSSLINKTSNLPPYFMWTTETPWVPVLLIYSLLYQDLSCLHHLFIVLVRHSAVRKFAEFRNKITKIWLIYLNVLLNNWNKKEPSAYYSYLAFFYFPNWTFLDQPANQTSSKTVSFSWCCDLAFV